MINELIIETQVKNDNIITNYEFENDDICNICKIPLTNKNGSILSVIANDFDQSKVYCTFCCSKILHKINEMTAEPWNIKLCRGCKVPKKQCKCNAEKIDYQLRKKLI